MRTSPNAAVLPPASTGLKGFAMRTTAIFTPSLQDMDRLIVEHPFALLCSEGPTGSMATPLPLMLERDDQGGASLIGHFARANPHVAALQTQPEALVVFLGPHGYISPSWFGDRSQAPTWNYATVHMRVRVRFDASISAAKRAVETLSSKMEEGRPNPWSPRDMGERYERLLPAIIAFEATVLDTSAKFKLGQNERLDVFNESLQGLAEEKSPTLHALMRHANSARLDVEILPPKGTSFGA
jgi:transcriptional regulator